MTRFRVARIVPTLVAIALTLTGPAIADTHRQSETTATLTFSDMLEIEHWKFLQQIDSGLYDQALDKSAEVKSLLAKADAITFEKIDLATTNASPCSLTTGLIRAVEHALWFREHQPDLYRQMLDKSSDLKTLMSRADACWCSSQRGDAGSTDKVVEEAKLERPGKSGSRKHHHRIGSVTVSEVLEVQRLVKLRDKNPTLYQDIVAKSPELKETITRVEADPIWEKVRTLSTEEISRIEYVNTLREEDPALYTRVIEADPELRTIVTQYEHTPLLMPVGSAVVPVPGPAGAVVVPGRVEHDRTTIVTPGSTPAASVNILPGHSSSSSVNVVTPSSSGSTTTVVPDSTTSGVSGSSTIVTPSGTTGSSTTLSPSGTTSHSEGKATASDAKSTTDATTSDPASVKTITGSGTTTKTDDKSTSDRGTTDESKVTSPLSSPAAEASPAIVVPKAIEGSGTGTSSSTVGGPAEKTLKAADKVEDSTTGTTGHDRKHGAVTDAVTSGSDASGSDASSKAKEKDKAIDSVDRTADKAQEKIERTRDKEKRKIERKGGSDTDTDSGSKSSGRSHRRKGGSGSDSGSGGDSGSDEQ